MAIRLSDCNAASTTFHGLALPAGATDKPANRGFVAAIWVRHQLAEASVTQVLNRGNGGTSSDGGYLRLWPNIPSARLRLGTLEFFPSTDLVTLTPGVSYCLMLIGNATHTHLVAAPVDGSAPIYSTPVAQTVQFTNAATDVINGIGGTHSTRGTLCPIEGFTFLTGELGGATLDDATIRAFASGTLSPAGLAAAMTSGTLRCHYPLSRVNDYADATLQRADLVEVTRDVSLRRWTRPANGIRPNLQTITPTPTIDCMSQVEVWGANPSATIRVPGGTYTANPEIVAIQSRLISMDTGAVIRDWTTTDAAPTATTYAPGAFQNVLVSNGVCRIEQRAVDSEGQQVGNIVDCSGLVGAGFHLVCTGETHFTRMQSNISNDQTLPTGNRAYLVSVATSAISRDMLSIDPTNRIDRGRGLARWVQEVNARFPGVPITISTLAGAGAAITAFTPGGSAVARWQTLATAYGVTQPYMLLPLGHVTGADTNYRTQYQALIAEATLRLGAPLRVISAPVPRYARAGTESNFIAGNFSRNRMREWARDNPNIGYWVTSLGSIESEGDPSSSNINPTFFDRGTGRIGSVLGHAAMAAVGAIPQRTAGIVSGTYRNTGGELRLRVGYLDRKSVV